MKQFVASLLLLGQFAISAPVLARESNDPNVSDQWYLEQIGAFDAWDTQTDASSVVVAIIDSGIDLDHPDLAGNIWVNDDPIDGIDNDQNGFIDDRNGWDFVSDDNDPTPDVTEDELDPIAMTHGTMVAGIVGALGNNSVGTSGIAWRVRLMSLRGLNSAGAGSSTDVANAIYYAVANGADIINLSFSGYESDDILNDAIAYAFHSGVVIVAAMGNANVNANDKTVYPVCLRSGEDDYVIGVGASDRRDERADFSNYGSECTDLVAPGVSIFGLSYQDAVNGYDDFYDNGWQGTSVAAPMVVGASALLLAKYPNLTPTGVRLALEAGVDAIPDTEPEKAHLGAGRLNVAKALTAGESFVTPEEAGEDARYIRTAGSSAVYAVVKGKRYIFINSQSYFTWEDDFSPVEVVTDAELGAIDLGGIALPKYGVVLVKIQSVPAVFAVMQNPENPYRPYLRHIKTEEVAIAMYGSDWADYVIDVEPTHFSKFGEGAVIESPIAVDKSIMKKRTSLAK